MSYCRFGGDSDVYVYKGSYRDGTDYITCCWCPISKGDDPYYEHPLAAFNHLQEHIAAGDIVPQYALDRLAREAADLAEGAHIGSDTTQVAEKAP